MRRFGIRSYFDRGGVGDSVFDLRFDSFALWKFYARRVL
jgi:hypothetical protein